MAEQVDATAENTGNGVDGEPQDGQRQGDIPVYRER